MHGWYSYSNLSGIIGTWPRSVLLVSPNWIWGFNKVVYTNHGSLWMNTQSSSCFHCTGLTARNCKGFSLALLGCK